MVVLRCRDCYQHPAMPNFQPGFDASTNILYDQQSVVPSQAQETEKKGYLPVPKTHQVAAYQNHCALWPWSMADMVFSYFSLWAIKG